MTVFFGDGQLVAKMADSAPQSLGVVGGVKPLLLVAGKAHVDATIGKLVYLIGTFGEVLTNNQT